MSDSSTWFSNQTSLTVEVVRFSAGGDPKVSAVLQRGASAQVAVKPGETWGMRDQQSGRRLWPRKRRQGQVLTPRQVRSPRRASRQQVALTLRNDTPFPLTVHRVDADRAEHRVGTLQPGQARVEQTSPGTVFRARTDAEGIHLHTLIVAQEPQQTWGIESTALSVVNDTLLSVDLLWEDSGGRLTRAATLPPHGALLQDNRLARRWRLRDSRTQVDLASLPPTRRAHTWTLRTADLRSQDGGRPVRVSLHNANRFPVQVLAVDPAGASTPAATIEAGGSAALSARSGDLWRVVLPRSGDDVDAFTVGRKRTEVLQTQLRSPPSRTSAQVHIVNETTATLEAFWIDLAGGERRYQALHPHQALAQSTYTAHAWLVREASSGEAISAGFGRQAPHITRIREPAVRSLPGTDRRTVRVESHTAAPIALSWVDHSGEEQPRGTLAPGDHGTIEAAPSHALRARLADSGDDIATFIVGTGTDQVWRIQLISAPTAALTTIEFRNRTRLEVDVLWIDFRGDEFRYITLSPEQAHAQSTYVGHLWMVRDHRTQQLLHAVAAAPAARVLEIGSARPV